MSNGILKVDGTKLVDGKGNSVILRGTAIGGWMNMENFITGFPGHESAHRAAMLEVLGQEKYEFFFDKWLEYFFTEADAKYFASLGLNCLRLPFNYRHLEDDMNPRVLKEGGFKHLDRVVEICAAHNIYTILDMHTLPGGQSPGWHSDNTTSYAAFWDYKDHQDRTVWLWTQIAARYKSNPWVAGYNLINEPADPKYIRLPAFYKRLEKEVRAIDPDHVLWLDGNTMAMEFTGFTETLPNTIYSLHDYSNMGFPTGTRYKGTPEQKEALERQFLRKAAFQHEHGTPIWNGEFGPVYANPDADAPEVRGTEDDAHAINAERYALLAQQLEVYDKYQIHWSIWLYKDIGLQGMVHTSRESAWNKLLGPWLERKKTLQVDMWGRNRNLTKDSEVEKVMKPVIEWVEKVSPTAKDQYPRHWDVERFLERAVLQSFLADSLQMEFAGLFRGKSFEELDELARSFHFDNCVQREGLNSALSRHAKLVAESS
ncbi:hypothetical protein FQN51_004036 [Onygenales sp. PD_10]|nr:hypothetical protein FQN51_004036 [Onygenales sp. PD_10]